MSTSPFFSGRIPQELYDKAEEHCKDAGKKKTDLLVEALSTYLNFPVRTQTTNFVPQPAEVTKEMFELLQQQVNKLELLITQIQSDVITQHDDRSNSITTLPDNTVVIHDNSSDNSTTTSVDNTNDSHDNKSDNNQDHSENLDNTVVVNDNSNDISESKSADNNPDNSDNQNIVTQKIPAFQSITSGMVVEKTGLKQTQLDTFRSKVAKKYKKEQKVLTPKTLLEQPEEIKTDAAITVDNTDYQLLYLGQNSKGQNLWSLIYSDNTDYHSDNKL